MRPDVRMCAAAATLAAAGCAPGAGQVAPDCEDGMVLGAGDLRVTLEPEAPLDRAPAAVRLHVQSTVGDAAELDPARFVVIQGTVGSAQLGQLARDDVSATLRGRIVPSLSWSSSSAQVVVAPTALLTAGETYTIASGSPRWAAPFTVAPDASVLHLVWPPNGRASGRRNAVWCADAPVEMSPTPVTLAPDGEEGSVSRGAALELGATCVHFDGAPPTDDGTAPRVAPPALTQSDGTAPLLLEPTPLTATEAAVTPMAPACQHDELPLARACMAVADDRMRVATPDVPLLWAIAGAATELVHASAASEPFLVTSLPPASSFELAIATRTLDGTVDVDHATVTTMAPMAHVVISEVLANPVGQEPEQEWIELYNDGLAAAQLEGWVLADVGGATALPAVTLGPGQFAVVVNDAYDAASEHDPAPAPLALVLRVPELGNNGLSNEGEPLKLIDAEARAVSRFPAQPKPKPGRSVMRVHPKALDELASSFALSADAPTPGAENL